MAPRVPTCGCCCVCGKNKVSHPGVRLHLFPRDARRRMQWLQRINIAYEKNSQAICEDHFEDCFFACKGRLLPSAVPRLTEDRVIARSPNQNLQPESIYEFAVSENSGVDASAEDSLLHIDLGGDKNDPNFEVMIESSSTLHQDLCVQESFRSPTVIDTTEEGNFGGGGDATSSSSVRCPLDHAYARGSDTIMAEHIVDECVTPVVGQHQVLPKLKPAKKHSGPVQRRVVKTEDGSKKTMIVTKASLKNLQAKGLIRPVKRCTPDHLNASQALLRTNIIQFGSDRTKNHSDHVCENLVSRKDELSRQDSSLKESVMSCESQESRIDSNSDHPPIKVPCTDVSVPHTLPSAFSAEVNKSSETNHPPQQQTASSSIDPHCTVNQPRTQIKVTEDNNQASSSNFSQISTPTSSKCKRLPPVIQVNIADGNIKVGGNREDNLTKTKPQSRDNVQCIAMPSAPVHQSESASSGTAAQECKTDSSISNKISPIAFTSSKKPGIIYKAIPLQSLLKNGQKLHIPSNKSANKELKVKYSRLLRKHQYRYRRLLEKYKILEQNHLVVKEVGTPQQIIRDARKYLSEEHVLFLESQMFLKNRPGTGNRYSRKFVKLMIEYYKRSAAGYRYLKTIFTLPCVSTVVKWLNYPSVLGDSSDVPSGNGSDVVNPHSSLKICSSQNTSNSKFSERKAAVKNLEYEENLSNSERSEESSSEDD